MHKQENRTMEEKEVREQVLSLLKDLHPESEDLETNKELVHSGELNSLDIVTLVSELSDTFDIEISPKEIVYENFDSLDGLVKMVLRLSD